MCMLRLFLRLSTTEMRSERRRWRQQQRWRQMMPYKWQFSLEHKNWAAVKTVVGEALFLFSRDTFRIVFSFKLLFFSTVFLPFFTCHFIYLFTPLLIRLCLPPPCSSFCNPTNLQFRVNKFKTDHRTVTKIKNK